MKTKSTCVLVILVSLAAGHIVNATAADAQGPYPPSPVIADMVLDWSTHQRHAQGSDNFQLTWADDDHQYGAWGDGGGFGGSNSDGRVGLGFARIEGAWDNYKGFNVWGGKDAENRAQFTGKSWGTICVDGVLYSWITPDQPDTGDPRDHYRYIELAKSADHGAHWTKADWRWWREDNLIIPTFLVYGRNSAGARDEYVYSYFIRPQDVNATQSTLGLNVHKPGGLFLARVRHDRIFAGRDAYEWFTGISGGKPTWGPLANKKPVFENPDGTGWCVSASYNPGLDRYLLATEHSVSHAGVMSLFDAPEPWGLWTTVKYWTTEDRFGDVRPGGTLDWADNVFFISFAPKWFSEDGRRFTLVFTGGGRGKNNDSLNTVRGTFQLRNLARATAHVRPAKGPLHVHSSNPRYFTDGTTNPDGSLRAVYLTGSHTWNNFQHNGVYPHVDYDEYLDFLEKQNHNFVRMWAWEQGGWDPWSAGYVIVEPVPYARTGPGSALDDKPKYDLTKFNDQYFERLRSRVAAAQERGIYISVMLFQGWSVEKKGQVGNPWQGHPFNQANNINGIDGDLNGDGEGPEIHTLSAPPEILRLQQAYVRRVIDTVNDLDNVLYEIGNEMHPGSVAWQYRMIKFIHDYERTMPKQHPVGMTGAPIQNAALFGSPADWIAPTGKDGYSTDPPAADGRKVIISDVDHVWPKQYRQWVWKSFTRGLSTAFMDLYGATRIGDKSVASFGFVGDWSAQHETVRRNLGYTRILAERMNLAAMTPRPELASTGFCLAEPGRQYLVYLPDGGEVRVDLSAASGSLTVEWFNPRSGETAQVQSTSGGQRRSYKPPFDGDAVLCVLKQI